MAMSLVLVAVAVVDRLQRGLLPLPRTLAALSLVVWASGIIIAVAMAPGLFKAATFGMWQIVAALVALAIAELAGRPAALRKVLIAWLLGACMVALSGAVIDLRGFGDRLRRSRGDRSACGRFAQPNEYGALLHVGGGLHYRSGFHHSRLGALDLNRRGRVIGRGIAVVALPRSMAGGPSRGLFCWHC